MYNNGEITLVPAVILIPEVILKAAPMPPEVMMDPVVDDVESVALV